ncbi:hypothetical protein BX666DRAFT_1876501 [Dichotomocladium elegans]|nr:hypothetical protein BX666DRAFT_1876501 [Dichotomocladium elegans]
MKRGGPFLPSMIAEAMASTRGLDRLVDYSSPLTARGAPSRSLPTVNRAQVLIERLDGWRHVLKEATIWLEEVAKINAQSSQQYYRHTLPHVEWNDRQIQRNTAIGATVLGLRFLTAQVIAKQKSATAKIRKEYVEQLKELRKECKTRLENLKTSQLLHTGELLKFAENTQKHIKQLEKLCKAADLAGGRVKHDPWLENLYVLCSLKAETDEDNRLRKLMGTIQQQTAELESRIIAVLKPSLLFCYNHFSGELSAFPERTEWHKERLERIDASKEWSKFLSNEKDLVQNANDPIRDYLQINYKNKNHRSAIAIFSGNAVRQAGGVRKQCTERFYVLTHYKVTPINSVFIPNTKVTPSISMDCAPDNNHPPPGGYTIEIKRTATLQREKTIVLRLKDREELIAWSRPLIEVSSRYKSTPSWKRIQRRSTTAGGVNKKLVPEAGKLGSSDSHLPGKSATHSLKITKSDSDLVRRRPSDPFVSLSPDLSLKRRSSDDIFTGAYTATKLVDEDVPAEANQNESAVTDQVWHPLGHRRQEDVVDTEKKNDELPTEDRYKVAAINPIATVSTLAAHEGIITESGNIRWEEKDNTKSDQSVVPFERETSTCSLPQHHPVVISYSPFGIDEEGNDEDDDDSIMDDAF